MAYNISTTVDSRELETCRGYRGDLKHGTAEVVHGSGLKPSSAQEIRAKQRLRSWCRR